MTNIYYYHLDDESKTRYSEKLEYDGITLPDPLDTELRLRLYKPLYHKISPNISFGDIYMYLVETEHIYTREEFKTYKNLDCYKMVSNSKVRDILAYKSESIKKCVLTCDIESNETTAKLFRTWAVITSEGDILNGHCTCMKGLEKVCCHVAALLLAVENTIKKENFVSQDSDDEEETFNSSKIMPVSDYFDKSKKKYMPVKFPDDTEVLTIEFKKHLEAIQKIVPHAPIFTLLPDDYSILDDVDQEIILSD